MTEWGAGSPSVQVVGSPPQVLWLNPSRWRARIAISRPARGFSIGWAARLNRLALRQTGKSGDGLRTAGTRYRLRDRLFPGSGEEVARWSPCWFSLPLPHELACLRVTARDRAGDSQAGAARGEGIAWFLNTECLDPRHLLEYNGGEVCRRRSDGYCHLSKQ